MNEELMEELSLYLADNPESESILTLSVNRAIRSFKNKRNYPSSYTDDKIKNDMKKCYDCIFDLALYFLVKQGAEFQGSHSESSVNRSWESEPKFILIMVFFLLLEVSIKKDGMERNVFFLPARCRVAR